MSVCEDTPETMQIDRILKAFGNGNSLKGYILLDAVASRLSHARTKHPIFAEGAPHALGVIGAEYDELVHAVEHEAQARQSDEALDVIATCLRFVGGEHLPAMYESK